MSEAASGYPFLREQAYDWIRDRILRAEFALGESLNRRAIAAQLRMSLLPVSEAFRKLEFDGLVETQPRVGTRVRVPALEDVEDFIVVRAALECESARQFCLRASTEDRCDLLDRAGRLDRLRVGASGGAYDTTRDRDLAYAIQSYHVEFHFRIVDGARCRALRRLMDEKHVLTMHWLYEVAAGSMAPLDSHTALARIVAGSDPERAAAAMREHIDRGSQDLLARFRAKHCSAAVEEEQPDEAQVVRRRRDDAANAKSRDGRLSDARPKKRTPVLK